MQASKLQPAVLGGVLIGVLSALPIVSAGNLCCCLWVLLGGAVAAYLLQQNQSTPLSVGDGAIVGMLAGLVGAVVGTVLTIPVLVMFGPLQAEYMARILDNPEIPPEAKQALGNFMPSGGVSVMWLMFTLFFSLVVDAIFGTLGGMLGALFFKKNPPPVPPPMPPAGFPPPLT
jgi:hypothetical protein